MRTLGWVPFAAVSAACASAPANVTAQYVSPLQYRNYDCDQLAVESQRIGLRASEVSGQQQQKANNDALATGVGIVLFWPALIFLASGDKSGELSRLKGESDAIEQAAIQKGCMTKPASQAAPPVSP